MLAGGTVFLQTTNFIDAAYIVAFGLMIYGMSGLTGPRTAVRGNQIAAVGNGGRGRSPRCCARASFTARRPSG